MKTNHNNKNLISPIQLPPQLKIQNERSLLDISDFNLESDNNSILTYKAFKPLVLAINGGSHSGKSFMSNWIKQQIGQVKLKVCILKEKYFFKIKQDDKMYKQYKFNYPEAINWIEMINTIEKLQNNKEVEIQYFKDYENNIMNKKLLKPAELIILEGRFLFTQKNILEVCDLKIFLNIQNDLILSRKIYNGIKKQKQLDNIINEYFLYLKPSYQKWIEPSQMHSDLVILNFGDKELNSKRFSQNQEVLRILIDLLKFRLKGSDLQAQILNEKMSLLNCKFQLIKFYFILSNEQRIKKKER